MDVRLCVSILSIAAMLVSQRTSAEDLATAVEKLDEQVQSMNESLQNLMGMMPGRIEGVIPERCPGHSVHISYGRPRELFDFSSDTCIGVRLGNYDPANNFLCFRPPNKVHIDHIRVFIQGYDTLSKSPVIATVATLGIKWCSSSNLAFSMEPIWIEFLCDFEFSLGQDALMFLAMNKFESMRICSIDFYGWLKN